MRIYTREECAKWCEKLVALDDGRKPSRDIDKAHRLRCPFPSAFTQMLWFSRCIESALLPRASCLVWVTDCRREEGVGVRVLEGHDTEGGEGCRSVREGTERPKLLRDVSLASMLSLRRRLWFY